MDNYLTHYYHKDENPFRTISSLSDDEAMKVIGKYDPSEALVYRRFKDPIKYLKERRTTELWLRDEFIKLGGKPVNKWPYYLVLGRSSYIFDGYNGECREIKLPMSEIDLEQVSFTYPDSMVSFWLSQRQDEEYYQPKYHGKVFTFDGIKKISADIKHEDNIWEKDKSRAFDFFVEAQIWSDEIIDSYIY